MRLRKLELFLRKNRLDLGQPKDGGASCRTRGVTWDSDKAIALIALYPRGLAGRRNPADVPPTKNPSITGRVGKWPETD